MERITYRKTLDVHKNGVQFTLQGFETADKLSRVIEISLMASGDAIDFPLERIVAMMYVTTPGATEPSINECTIKDNKVVYEVLPIVEEGITTMQLKLIEATPEGATSVLASPKFSVEVTKSGADDENAEQGTTFTALEDAVARAKAVYDGRFLRMELTNDCIFKAYYAGANDDHGAVYETDILKKLFYNGNVLLSESFAHGNTGTRINEDTDNAMYYSNVSKSESLKAKEIMANSEDILEEVKLHGMYTAFSVDYEKGEIQYVSPSYKFTINKTTGELETEGQSYDFDSEVYRVFDEWLSVNNLSIRELQSTSTTHTNDISLLKTTTETHTRQISTLDDKTKGLEDRVVPVEKGGTGCTSVEDFVNSSGMNEYIQKYQMRWNVDGNLIKIHDDVGQITTAPANDLVTKYAEGVITMKNSGKIYLNAYVEGLYNYWIRGTVKIFLNDKEKWTYSQTGTGESTIQKSQSSEMPILLNVNKGDIITIKVEGTMTGKYSYGGVQFNAVVSLYANFDTPFTYRTLFDNFTEFPSLS